MKYCNVWTNDTQPTIITIMNPKRVQLITLYLLFFSIASFFISLNSGSVHISIEQTTMMILHHSNSWRADVLWDVRFPRLVAAFVAGGLLALSGSLLQILLRNSLADPYILGISGGAAFFNLVAMALGFSIGFSNVFACLGSLASMLIVFLLALKQKQWSSQGLLLIGVMIAASWGALISGLLSISSTDNLRNLLYWLMGDLSYAQRPYISVVVLVIGLILSMLLAKSLNVLILGELRAKTLGVNTQRLQIKLYFLSALLTACAVTVSGPIGFIGLIVPHILRLLGIHDHRSLLPSSVLLGGSLLMLADTLARTLFAPIQLPVGIITTLIGVPIFLFLLQRKSPA